MGREFLKKTIGKQHYKIKKGVYLLTVISNGKMYVGSAYGKNMINGH